MVDFDIVIVGAGPAGATAALNLAPTRRVALVERRAKGAPRMGESLPPAARRLLSDMGLFAAHLGASRLPSYGNRSVWGEGGLHEVDFLRDADGNGWHLDRREFDAWLRHVAVERGAVLVRPARLAAIGREGILWRLSLRTATGPVGLTASIIIDCAGRAAPLARRLGAVRRPLGDRLVCGWILGRQRIGTGSAGFSVIEAVEHGWWYTAPLPRQQRVLAWFTDADLPQAWVARNHGALMAHAGATSAIGPLIGGGAFLPAHGGVCDARSFGLDRCTGPGWLAAGDASLTFDPVSSQGLLHALFTGLAAAEAADRFLTSGSSALASYQKIIDQVSRAYREHLFSCYAAETRWPSAPFWRRRIELLSSHAIGGARGDPAKPPLTGLGRAHGGRPSK